MERDGNKSPSFLGVYRPRGRASHVGHPQTNRRLFRTKLTKVIGSNYVGAEVQPRSSFSYVDAFLKAYYVSNQELKTHIERLRQFLALAHGMRDVGLCGLTFLLSAGSQSR